MSNTEENSALFEHVDSNQDGKIDKDEFNKWLLKTGIGGNVSYSSSNRDGYLTSRDINRYQRSVMTTDFINETAVFTNSIEETETYLSRHGIDICRNPNIVRRTTSDQAIDYEQRVFVRYLKPPTPPAPGPLIIEEVQEQLPPPPPLVIREQGLAVSSLPPLVLREQPPLPPPTLPTETTRRVVATIPQERSVIIERFPTLPEKPRDIIIERWLPYGPPPERQVIVKKSAVVEHEKPTCTVVVHENPQARITRKLEVLDVVNADPVDYTTRYRESLLDSTALVQAARREGVLEDIRLPPPTWSIGVNGDRRYIDYNGSHDIAHGTYSTRHVVTSGGVPYNTYTDSYLAGINNSDRRDYQTGYRTSTNTYVTRDGRLY